MVICEESFSMEKFTISLWTKYSEMYGKYMENSWKVKIFGRKVQKHNMN